LGEIVDNSNAIIPGTHWQKYEITFASIDVACYDCGAQNHIESEELNRLIDREIKFARYDEVEPPDHLSTKNKYVPESVEKYRVNKKQMQKLRLLLSEKKLKIYDELLKYGDEINLDSTAKFLEVSLRVIEDDLVEIKKYIAEVKL